LAKSGFEILGQAEYAWSSLERLEDTIRQFSDHAEINDDHLTIYSREMALTLLQVGSLVETTIKRIIRDDSLDTFPNVSTVLVDARRDSPPFPNIQSYRNILEPVFRMSRRSVNFRLYRYARNLNPFSTFARAEDVSPGWWKAYNSMKHDLFQNLKEATLEQVLNGSAALFLLSVLCRENWPMLLLNRHLAGGYFNSKLGMFVTENLNQEKLWMKLHEIFLPHLKVTVPVFEITDIFANSRLFFSHLAHLNATTKTYEIP
jgi:hypothetical protein